MQPQMKKKKTVTTPKAKHLKAKQVDHYCLRHQEEDSEGDVKTELYKVCVKGGGRSDWFRTVTIRFNLYLVLIGNSLGKCNARY